MKKPTSLLAEENANTLSINISIELSPVYDSVKIVGDVGLLVFLKHWG